MSIKTRLAKLEQRHHKGLPTVGRVIVNYSYADQAETRWLAENPCFPLPGLLIVRAIVSNCSP